MQDREDWNIEDLEQALKIFIILCGVDPAVGSGGNLEAST